MNHVVCRPASTPASTPAATALMAVTRRTKVFETLIGVGSKHQAAGKVVVSRLLVADLFCCCCATVLMPTTVTETMNEF